MLDASFLSLVTLTRRLNIGSADTSLVSSAPSSVISHLPVLPDTCKPLSATVIGTGTEHLDELNSPDLDDLDTLPALDPSDSEMPFESGSDESENDPFGAGGNTDLTEEGQSVRVSAG
jgi:hypothetical protein